MTSETLTYPFIKKFKDGEDYYIYDVNTNQIIEGEKPVYDIICQYRRDNLPELETRFAEVHGAPAIRKAHEEITGAVERHGLFSPSRPECVTMGIRTGKGVKQLHQNGLRQLILEITKDCNLRCSYCSASGRYAPAKHRYLHMSRENMLKALDFFCPNADQNEPAITFYGGEPLLRFDLIKETVEYVNRRYPGLNVSYNLTTNGTVLEQRQLEFFIQNDFTLMFSLDGPKNVNDRYRHFKNGRGTFDSIIRNLEFIKNHDIDYYRRRVSISSVLTPPFDDMDDIPGFFTTHPAMADMAGDIRSGLVETKDTSFLEDYGLENKMREFPQAADKLAKQLKSSILNGNLKNLTIEKTRIFSILNNIARRPIKELTEVTVPIGVCHIGLRRVFVDTSGQFHVCERAGTCYPSGDLENGFNYDLIASYYRQLDEVLSDCRNCWALLHCERCWAAMGNLDDFNGETKERFCNMNKKQIETAFVMYAQLLKEKPGCFKEFAE